jgi:hypothetical protein
MKCSKCGIPTFGPLCMYCKGEAIRPVASHHMTTTNPKPLLNLPIITRAELERYDKKGWLHDRILTKHTITTMAELLERWQKSQTPTTRMLISRQELESLWMETNQTVQTFNATGGDGS